MEKLTALMLAAVLLLVASSSHAENHHYYVSAANGKDCPPDSDCHSLSYYLSDPELYFTSITRITFLEGTHLLDREEPINISQVTGLILIGRGQWVLGPEETIMESTAVMYCTNGSGGFAFYGSSQISIINLSLINCGALHTDAQIKSTLLFLKISELNLHYVSIQNSSEHGVVLYRYQSVAHNCDHVEIYFCSIAFSNIDRKSLNSIQCKISSFKCGSNLLITYYASGSKSHLNVLNSNFTDACGDNYYGNLAVHAESNSHYVQVSLREIQIVQNIGSGIVILSKKTTMQLNFSDAIVIGAGKPMRYASGLYIKTYSAIFSLNMKRIAFYNNPEGQIHFVFHKGTVSGLQMNSIQFLHRHVVQKTFRIYAASGVFILVRNATIKAITFTNLTLSLNNAFHYGIFFKLFNTLSLPQTESVAIINSTFNANQKMQSVVSLEVNKPVLCCQCINNR